MNKEEVLYPVCQETLPDCTGVWHWVQADTPVGREVGSDSLSRILLNSMGEAPGQEQDEPQHVLWFPPGVNAVLWRNRVEGHRALGPPQGSCLSQGELGVQSDLSHWSHK